jgi:UDP-N-acetylmuramoyl-L-alanyl-D-glutamate--2,6-diaminopimelate ligase
MRLTELTAKYSHELISGGGQLDTEISSLANDLEDVEEGSLFFCLRGKSVDGHSLAKRAIKKGAAALVVEREVKVDVPQILVEDTRHALSVLSSEFYNNPSKRIRVIGITGTNGKTTTAHMLAAMLNAAGKKTGIIGTLGVRYGEERYDCPLTTPDPIFLQKTLLKMFAADMQYAVIEVSAHALYYQKTAGVQFAACICTNLSQDHLDFFADMQAYKQAKLMLFTPERCPLAIVNADDEIVEDILSLRKTDSPALETLTYSLLREEDAFANVRVLSSKETTCAFFVLREKENVVIPMIGKHNVYNALAAALCAVKLGVPLSTVANALCRFEGVDGRLQFVQDLKGAKIFVDFAHTPDGLSKSLQTLSAYAENRLICLFGCGGNRDKSKREMMGKTVAALADFSILTTDNPRFEDPLDIIREIEKGYKGGDAAYIVIPKREKAIEYALDIVQKGDVLLVAGKGGEQYQEIMGIKYPFNDNDILKKYCQAYENADDGCPV